MNREELHEKTRQFQFDTVAKENGIGYEGSYDRCQIHASYRFDTPAFLTQRKGAEYPVIKSASVYAINFRTVSPFHMGCCLSLSYSDGKEIVLRFPSDEEVYAALFAIVFMPEKVHYEVLKDDDCRDVSPEEFFLSNEKKIPPKFLRYDLHTWPAAFSGGNALFDRIEKLVAHKNIQYKSAEEFDKKATRMGMTIFLLLFLSLIPLILWTIIMWIPSKIIDLLYIIPAKIEPRFRKWEYCFDEGENGEFYITKRYCYKRDKRTIRPGWMIRWLL